MAEVSRIGSIGGAVESVKRDRPSGGLSVERKAEGPERGPGVAVVEKKNPNVESVAKLYEKQFLGEMLKAMRDTVKYTDEPSMATNIYRDQLDQQYVDSWGEHGGIGLSDIIYQQIMDKYFGDDSAKAGKTQGPVALSDRDVLRISRMASSPDAASKQIPLKVEVRESSDGSPARLHSPWGATILSKTAVGGRTAITVKPDGLLPSTLIFGGTATAAVQPGEKVVRGQTLGLLNPDERSFLWSLSPQVATAKAE